MSVHTTPADHGRRSTPVPRRLTALVLATVLAAVVAILGTAGSAAAETVGGACPTCVYDLTVGPTAVTVKVTSHRTTTSRMLLGRTEPTRRPDGSLRLDDPIAATGTTVPGRTHVVGFNRLDAGTRYYVVTTLVDSLGRSWWSWTSFTTWRRTVVVGYEYIRVINDADAGPDRGEISFVMNANNDEIANFEAKVSSGGSVAVQRAAAFHDAPQDLYLWISGHELDLCCVVGDVAVATRTIDLLSPGGLSTSPLDSGMPEGHDRYFVVPTGDEYLRFAVYGWYDVSYAP